MGKHVAQHGQARCPTWAQIPPRTCPLGNEYRTLISTMAQGEQENKAENKQPEEEVLQHLQILLNPKQNPNITDEILSKNGSVKDRSV